MRILFLSNFYPPADRGGWEQWCREVADAFRERGHEIWVLTSNYGLELVSEPEEHVVRSLYLESDLEHYRPADFFISLGQRDRHNERVLRELVQEIDPDVIFVWGMWQLSPGLATLAEELRPGRVAYYFCGYWPIEPDPHSAYWSAPEKKRWVATLKQPLARVAMAKQRSRVGRRPDFRHAAFVSRAVLELLAGGGITFGYTEVIYGGVDLCRFKREAPCVGDAEGSNLLRILYAGSLSAAKGVDTLLRATALLASDYSAQEFNLTLVGAGHPEFEAWARSYIAENELHEYVSIRGRIDHSQMPELLKSYDVLAFPSAWQEPLARMMMEGLAAGLVLVSTRTGGTGEVLENDSNSLTFEAGDEKALQRQFVRLLNEPGLKERLSSAGQATARELFDFKRMVNDLEAFVGQLVVPKPV